MPVGFESHNEFEQEATRLKQLYDLTVALCGEEHERIAEALKDTDAFETKHTEIGEIAHNLNQLYEYTKSRYPNRLRQLLWLLEKKSFGFYKRTNH
jgi:endonuclease III